MKGALIRDLHVTELRSAAEHLLNSGGRMQMVYAWYPPGETPELRYVATPADSQTFEVWRCKVTQEPPSLATIWPLLGWYEREVMDLNGIRFHDHPEPNRLVLPQHVPPPLAPSGQDTAWLESPPDGSGIRTLPEVPTEDVQALPFGPVRADVLESAEFTFLYIGEQILHYHPHLFFKHRGMEARFQGADAGARHDPGGARVRRRQRGARAGLLPGGGACRRLHRAAARLLAARAAGGTGAGVQPPALPRASLPTRRR